MKNKQQWAIAIAARITDELDLKKDFPEDAVLLKDVLERLFFNNPADMKKVIGTGLIEETYFSMLN